MKSFVIFLSCIFLSLLSCDNTRMKHSSEVEYIYFNERLINLFNQNSYPDFVAKMHEEYPGVFDFYNQFLLGIVDESKDYIASQADYQNFMSQEYPAILDSIRLKIYPDSALINREISRGFAQYNILFSEQIKPKIFYFFISPNGRNPASCFQFGIKDTFGVNLFGYLGRDFVFYPHLYPGVSYTYLWREHDYIAKNIMELLYEDFLTAQKIETAEITLINNMVLEAKRVYFLSQVLPEVPLEILFGYPKEKLTWCDDHINLIWTFLIENKLLQSSDPQAIKRYAHPGPSTPAISPESPGAVGVYIGYQIIKKFQQKNPSLSLPEILKTKSEEIIRHAQYKP